MPFGIKSPEGGGAGCSSSGGEESSLILLLGSRLVFKNARRNASEVGGQTPTDSESEDGVKTAHYRRDGVKTAHSRVEYIHRFK